MVCAATTELNNTEKKIWVGLESEFTRNFGHYKFDLCLHYLIGHVQEVVEYNSLGFGGTSGLAI